MKTHKTSVLAQKLYMDYKCTTSGGKIMIEMICPKIFQQTPHYSYFFTSFLCCWFAVTASYIIVFQSKRANVINLAICLILQDIFILFSSIKS